jgi:hypothetical protein
MNTCFRKSYLLFAISMFFINFPVFAQGNPHIWVKQISFNWTTDYPIWVELLNKNLYDISDAINIRPNPTEVYSVPEYTHERRGESIPAAYYGGERNVTIKVVFQTSDLSSFNYYIMGKANGGWMVLGDTNTKLVSFSGGISNEIQFTIPGTIPKMLCKRQVYWEWQGKISGNESLRYLDQTEHMIYILPDYPKSPWKYTGNLTNAPWVTLLDMVIDWASFYYLESDILKSMTIGIYNLGNDAGANLINHDATLVFQPKKYEAWATRGGYHYDIILYSLGYLKFDLWAVLDMTGKEFDNKRYNLKKDKESTLTTNNSLVDCTDLSGLLYSAARLIGIKNVNIQTISSDFDWLDLSRFYYREIRPIGIESTVGSITNKLGGYWTTHQVVSYLDPADNTRYIYDPCLKFVTDGDVEAEPPIHMEYTPYYNKLFFTKYKDNLPGFVWDSPTKVINEIANLGIFNHDN